MPVKNTPFLDAYVTITVFIEYIRLTKILLLESFTLSERFLFLFNIQNMRKTITYMIIREIV